VEVRGGRRTAQVVVPARCGPTPGCTRCRSCFGEKRAAHGLRVNTGRTWTPRDRWLGPSDSGRVDEQTGAAPVVFLHVCPPRKAAGARSGTPRVVDRVHWMRGAPQNRDRRSGVPLQEAGPWSASCLRPNQEVRHGRPWTIPGRHRRWRVARRSGGRCPGAGERASWSDPLRPGGAGQGGDEYHSVPHGHHRELAARAAGGSFDLATDRRPSPVRVQGCSTGRAAGGGDVRDSPCSRSHLVGGGPADWTHPDDDYSGTGHDDDDSGTGHDDDDSGTGHDDDEATGHHDDEAPGHDDDHATPGHDDDAAPGHDDHGDDPATDDVSTTLMAWCR